MGSGKFHGQRTGKPVTNHGEKLYWSFTEKPASTLGPVIVTVTATDPATGRVLGNSTATLGWDGDFAVMVKEIRKVFLDQKNKTGGNNPNSMYDPTFRRKNPGYGNRNNT